jgi:hypothetical protein
MTKRKGELTEAEFTDAASYAELKAEGIDLEEGGGAIAVMDPPEAVVAAAPPGQKVDATHAGFAVEGGFVFALTVSIRPDAITGKADFQARLPGALQVLKQATDARDLEDFGALKEKLLQDPDWIALEKLKSTRQDMQNRRAKVQEEVPVLAGKIEEAINDGADAFPIRKTHDEAKAELQRLEDYIADLGESIRRRRGQLEATQERLFESALSEAVKKSSVIRKRIRADFLAVAKGFVFREVVERDLMQRTARHMIKKHGLDLAGVK